MSLVSNTNVDPTTEIGNAQGGLLPWNAFYDNTEDVAELAFPASVAVYNKMRNDSQIAALLLSFMLPIFGYRWYVDPNGARDEVVEHVAGDFNLPIEGQDARPTGRQRDRFSFGDYLYHSMLKMAYGFMFHEQVYRLGEDRKLHIRKLAPRMPGSIWQIQTANDGGLDYIRQYPAGQTFDPNRPRSYFQGFNTGALGYTQGPIIPVDRLVAHVQDKEGANWYGRSWLRAIYKDWLIKDRLIRVDAIKHERNGLGVPDIEAPPTASKAQMETLAQYAQQYKAGETAGGSRPAGSKFTLQGVSGSLPDTLSSIKYYDEQMAKRFLAMFTSLGQSQTGSRALGNTFVDFFGLAQQSMAKSIVDTTNAHVIEDIVDLNYTVDEAAPLIKFKPESDRALATSDLVALVQVGALTADSTLEDWIRAEADLPERDAGDPLPSGPTQPNPPAAAHRKRPHAGILNSVEPRKATDAEEQSKVDFQALKAAFDSALTQLVKNWNAQIKPKQIEQLGAAIAATAADDLAGMAAISATAIGSELLTTAMHELAAIAAKAAKAEISAQGHEMDLPDLAALNAVLSNRSLAIDTLMASSISQAAREVALREAGGNLSSLEIAVDVQDHLTSLTDTYLKDELGGALMNAQNAARRTVFNEVPNKNIYASELLDNVTCIECEKVDGTNYADMDRAEADYPNGGYKDCLGGYRCRGTLVCVLSTESDASK